MTTAHIKYAPPFTSYVVGTGALTAEPFSLVDVGASGGIEHHWHVFGESLTAVGFEPLIAEVERLKREAMNPRIRYEAMRVTSRDRTTVRALQTLFNPDNAYKRTSALRVMSPETYMRMYYDPSGAGAVSDEATTIDEWQRHDSNPTVDFLKVDTDGHDYYVLRGAEATLSASPVLGIQIECQFHGAVHPHSNVFSNIDRFLRRYGFTLLDLDVYRYSKAALPKPFAYDSPGPTTEGQVVYGEAVYARDAGDPEYEAWGPRLSSVKLLKLGCIQEIFGCGDCTAELILKYAEQLREHIDIERSLDLLTPTHRGETLSFRDYNRRFDTSQVEWYPKKAQEPPLPEVTEKQLVLMEKRVVELQALMEKRVAELQARQVALLDTRVAELQARVAELQARQVALLDSTCWKLTAPLRMIFDSSRRLMSSFGKARGSR